MPSTMQLNLLEAVLIMSVLVSPIEEFGSSSDKSGSGNNPSCASTPDMQILLLVPC